MRQELHRFAHEAMATTFEIVIAEQTARYARQAAQAAFDEIDRIEMCLSRFIESSDVSRINIIGAKEPVRVSIDTFECLRLAAQVYNETSGAFDVTMVRHGMAKVELNEKQFSVRLGTVELSIDLGGIGKGFALDKAAETLSGWSVESALIHGGESSALAIGPPPGEEGWPVRVGRVANETDTPELILLRDGAVSASGTRERGQHVIDPRTGRPAEGALRAWAKCPSGAISDALSTAFMVMSPAEVERYCREHTDTWAMLLIEDQQGRRLVRTGYFTGRRLKGGAL